MIEIFDNIRKIYYFSRPCTELAGYIEFFSESSTEKTFQLIPTERFTVEMFQSWTPTFWFNLSSPYIIEFRDKRQIVKQNDDILVVRDTTVIRHVVRTDRIFTVKFCPGGLEAVLGINQAKLTGKMIYLRDILPTSLIQGVKQAASYENRLQLLQNYFLITRHEQQKKRQDHYLRSVKNAIDSYQDEGFLLNTGQVADKLFITAKTINRYFHKAVGISPKKYFSIVRARAALTQHANDRKYFDPNQFGYYDMSHFYKDITNFTGRRLGDQSEPA